MARNGPHSPTGKQFSSIPRGWAGFLIGPALFGLAAWFIWGQDLSEVPIEEGPKIQASAIQISPRRTTLSDPPQVHIGGFDRNCMDCHRIFDASGAKPDPDRQQHGHIQLAHGPNVRCDTCHHVEDRDALTRLDGTLLSYGESEKLCAQCHSRVFADWERGMHGRTNGYWDSTRGTLRRLRCTECHDPHGPRHPAMDPLKPLPGPLTLRMGDPEQHVVVDQPLEEDPLRRALQAADRESGEDR